MDAIADVPADVPVVLPVTVTVIGAQGLESGVTVVYEDSGGAVTGTGTTGVTGTASKIVPAGSMVTVLLGTPANPNLYTAMGVQPGNNVLVLDWASASSFNNLYANLTSIGTAPDAGVSTYIASAGGCNMNWDGSVPTSMWLQPNALPPCIGVGQFGTSYGASFPLLVEADDAQGNLLGFAFSKNNGLSMLDDAGMADVALTGSWSTATTTQVLSATNGDGGTVSANLAYSEIAGGILNPLNQYTAADAGGQMVVHTHAGTPAFADAVQFEAATTFSNTANAVAQRGAPPTADGTTVVDVTAFGTLPQITNAGANITTPSQPTYSWTLSQGDLSAMTGVVATLSWSATLPEGGSQSGSWTLVSPGTTQTSLTAPALPAASSGYAPPASGGVSGNGGNLFAIDGNSVTPSALPTYGDLLLLAPTLYPQGGCFTAPYFSALPKNGTAALAVYAPQGC